MEAGRRELLSAESKAPTDSPLQAPVWLLPAALDVVAFMAIWTAFSGGRSKPTTVRNPRVKGTRRKANRRQRGVSKVVERTANDNNVVSFPAA